MSQTVVRVVLDTTVLLSALVFTSGTLVRFRKLWETGKILPFTSKEATTELMCVLAYTKFKLSAQQQRDLLADYLPFAHIADISPAAIPAALPICRDPLDQMFLDLAQASRAHVLVTGDQDLLALANEPGLPFAILKPVDFLTQHPFSSVPL